MRLLSKLRTRRGRRHRHRPPVVHDLPAVPARGLGRLAGRAARRRAAAQGAQGRRDPQRAGAGGRPRPQAGPGRTPGGAGLRRPYDIVVVALGSIARTLPIPGLAEEAVGLQDRRGGDLPAQPGAREPGRRGVDCGRGPAPARADLRLHRRRLRRGRGDGRARGHGPRSQPVTTAGFPPRTCASSWSRRPTGSCPRWARTWASRRSSSCASAASRWRSSTRLESCVDGRGQAVQRRDRSSPTRSSGPPA